MTTDLEKIKFAAIGRRKEAVARIYLKPGKGNMVVNGTSLATEI